MSTATVSKLTAEQAAALAAHDRSVSLAAGAGCGKTFVLTERFLANLDPLVLEPTAELDELVAITFTDAAAREMRDRIRRRAYDRLQQATNSDERRTWQRLIRQLDTAQISTIHSFCATLLRQHAAEVGVDPRFTVLDGPTALLLRLQTLDDHLRELLAQRDERVIRLAVRMDLRGLRDAIGRLVGEDIGPVLAKWRDAKPADLAAAWRNFYEQSVVPQLTQELVASDPFGTLRKLCQNPEVSKPEFAEHAQRIVDVLDQLATVDTSAAGSEPNALASGAPVAAPPHAHPRLAPSAPVGAPAAATELRQLARVQGVCAKKDWVNPEDFEQFRDACKAVRDLIDRSPLTRPLDTDAMLESAQAGLDLLHLVAEVAERYRQAKVEENALEFDDLLQKAHALLTDPRHRAIQHALADGTRLLMVDEFQDTDPRQVAIVEAFCGKDWQRQGLFVVGDHKQSIYRFRGAKPEVSEKLRADLGPEGQLSLTTNFRSQPAILDFVNALFQAEFKDYEPLRPSRKQSAKTPTVEFLWAVGEDPDAEPTSNRTPAQQARMREAQFIARRVVQLVDSGEPIIEEHGRLRPLRLGDVAILMRALSDVALYEEALREQGLDYYLAGGHAFYAQQEIYDVLHLLRAVASSADELSLAGALRSPIFALTDETLFWLVEEQGSLNRGLFAPQLPHQLADDQRVAAARAASTLGELRAAKDRLLVAELLNLALERTGYDAALLCEFLGHRKLANVHKLVEQARTLDGTRPGDLTGFITQLSEFVLRAPREPLATTSAEGDVVRLMSIHNAKGLEFPLVVVPDLERRARGDWGPVFDVELGPLVPAVERPNEKKPLVGLDLYRKLERQEDSEERKRILYVACTRAADYLILSSSVKDLAKPNSDWMKLLASRFDLASGRCLAQLPPGYAVPQIRAITEEPESERKPVAKTRGADLVKLVEQTRELAEAGGGIVPATVRPIPADARAQRRFSFSRLTGALKKGEQEKQEKESGLLSNRSDPFFTATADAVALGTLVHEVLERIDFKAPNDVEGHCRFLAPQHLDVNWQAGAATATELVTRLLASPRAAEFAQARTIRREVEFLLPWQTIDPTAGPYLHGFIDCLYQDAAGAWHVIDFKTNQITVDAIPAVAAHYALQMFVYREACRQALGVPPVECVLHFLRPSREFVFEFDDAQEAELAAQFTHAIRAQLFA